ncbi:Trm112 family protein [Phyllobacterium sp. 628]|uniref:Trm112 family protein n=1 Tax=Phyllobacterium sp. 628 TaxID=2718938 RepID=UPI00166261FC|nr:Trm112 family protein [Phyllobacterium sp. 628]QND51194.1 Trm112 family protein [Phyllobacterium sp. 628]
MTDPKREPTIDRKLLELLVCPLTKGSLVYDQEKSELISKSAHLAYPIRDGIPIMLPSEARAIED